MKNTVSALFALLLGVLHTRAQLVASLDDIQNWTGTGTNRSALVLQWNDGNTPVSFVWGYRWNEVASGLDMLKAIAGTTTVREPGGGAVIETFSGADASLELAIERYGFGDAIYSIVYTSGTTVRTQGDWDSGYWEYALHGGNFEYSEWDGTQFVGPFVYAAAGATLYSSVAWWSSQIGASDRGLVDGSWDAYSFAPGFVPQAVVQPSAAPPLAPSLSCSMVGGDMNIAFRSETGSKYLLLYSDGIDGTWSPLGDAVSGDGAEIVFVDALPGDISQRPAKRFYRVIMTR